MTIFGVGDGVIVGVLVKVGVSVGVCVGVGVSVTTGVTGAIVVSIFSVPADSGLPDVSFTFIDVLVGVHAFRIKMLPRKTTRLTNKVLFFIILPSGYLFTNVCLKTNLAFSIN
jgi:hypothetical protein